MTKFTKEQLIAHITPKLARIKLHPQLNDNLRNEALMNKRVLEIALAALTAEPVGFIARHKETGKFGSYLHPKADWFKNDDYEVMTAYTAPPASVVPEGWTLAPIEPTSRMYDAGDRQLTTKQVWDAMLAAAPQQEAK